MTVEVPAGRRSIRSLCVYCGSSPGVRPEPVVAARALGRLLGERGIRLIYGGASVGVMGALADATLAGGGEVVGVIPKALLDKEVAHAGLTELVVTGSMHERKAAMADRADAFVALPGGLGTLEELFEVWTWSQLGFHAKPCGLLEVAGYFAPLVAFLDHAVADGFVKPVHRAILQVADDPEVLLAALEAYRPPTVEKWMERGET